MTSRRWCFTSYAENVCPWAHGEDGADMASAVRYAVFQQERCGATQRLHWQGYIELRTPMRMPALRRIVGDPRCHLESARGSRAANKDYCTKEDTRHGPPVEFGAATRSGQGARNDIGAALELIRNMSDGNPVLPKLWDEHGTVMVKYPRGLANAYNHYAGRLPRGNAPHVSVHWGPTGTGKSHAVYDSTDLSDLWRSPVTEGCAWYDGYYGQPTALFDDFDGEHPGIMTMLAALDKYPVQLPVKGGFIWFHPKVIYITSNLAFSEWYPQARRCHRAALRRRIDTIIHFSQPYVNREPTSSDSDIEPETV